MQAVALSTYTRRAMRTPSSARKRKGGEVPVADGAPEREDPKRRSAGVGAEPAAGGEGGAPALPGAFENGHRGAALGRTSSGGGQQQAPEAPPAAQRTRPPLPPPKMAPPPPSPSRDEPRRTPSASRPSGHAGFVRRPSQGQPARPNGGDGGDGGARGKSPEVDIVADPSGFGFGFGAVGGSSAISAPSSSEVPGPPEIADRGWADAEFEVWVPCGVLLILCLTIIYRLCEGTAASLVLGVALSAGGAVLAVALISRKEREMWWARTLFNDLPVSVPVTVVFFATLFIFSTATRHSQSPAGAMLTCEAAVAATSSRPAAPLAAARQGLMNRLRRLRAGPNAAAASEPGAASAAPPGGGAENASEGREGGREVLWGLLWGTIVLGIPYLSSRSPVRARTCRACPRAPARLLPGRPCVAMSADARDRRVRIM